MKWLLLLALFSSVFLVDYIIRRVLRLGKAKRHRPFTAQQRNIEIGLLIVFILAMFISGEGENVLLRVPSYVVMSLYFFILYVYRGIMVYRYEKESREYYVHFAYAVWTPIVLVSMIHVIRM